MMVCGNELDWIWKRILEYKMSGWDKSSFITFECKNCGNVFSITWEGYLKEAPRVHHLAPFVFVESVYCECGTAVWPFVSKDKHE